MATPAFKAFTLPTETTTTSVSLLDHLIASVESEGVTTALKNKVSPTLAFILVWFNFIPVASINSSFEPKGPKRKTYIAPNIKPTTNNKERNAPPLFLCSFSSSIVYLLFL